MVKTGNTAEVKARVSQPQLAVVAFTRPEMMLQLLIAKPFVHFYFVWILFTLIGALRLLANITN